MLDGITYSLSADARRVVEPVSFADPGLLAVDPSLAPDQRGIYGWWFKPDALTEVPYAATQVQGGLHLLYVGICPNGSNPESKRTLRSRMKEHCRGPIRTSTLRRTLTALLAQDLKLGVGTSPSGKQMLHGDGEVRLTRWMSDHVRVAWIEHEAPWRIEHELIGTIAPPLNIMGSAHPNAAVLRARRAGKAVPV